MSPDITAAICFLIALGLFAFVIAPLVEDKQR